MHQNNKSEENIYLYGNKIRLRYLHNIMICLFPLVILSFFVYSIVDAIFMFILYLQFYFFAAAKYYRKKPEIIISDCGIEYYKFYYFKDIIFWQDIYGLLQSKGKSLIIEHRVHINNKGNFLSKIKRIFPERHSVFRVFFLHNINNEELNKLVSEKYKKFVLKIKEQKKIQKRKQKI